MENNLFDISTGIWNVDEQTKGYHLFDSYLAECLSNYFHGKTVLDLGCGLGDYIKKFKENRIICEGYDGNPNTVELTNGVCGVLDLTKEISLPVFGWVMSLEVGEHIPSEFEDIFIDNLHRHNREGILLSWAVEGQGGIGHINCRNNDYIIDKIEKLGYKYDETLSNSLRENATFPYFKNTLMLFKKI